MQRRLFITIAAALISSCSHIVVGDSKVFGRTREVSLGDIQAVIAAFNATKKAPELKAYQIRVMNRDEMRVFWYQHLPDENYKIFRRRNGRWIYVGDNVVL